jgi:N-acetylmuramoyl-L-alanine amidase
MRVGKDWLELRGNFVMCSVVQLSDSSKGGFILKRKLVALVLSMILCSLAVMPIALAGTPTSFVKLPPTMGGLNVRSGPGTNYKVTGWVVDGDEIDLIKVGSTWTKITVLRTDKTGYIRNNYIKDLKDGDVPSTSGTATAGRVTGKGVGLRKGAGAGYAKVATLSLGTKLKLWDKSGNWYYATTLSGKKGWISKTYIATGYAMTTSASVNLRKSANGAIVKKLDKGTKVSVESITGGWSKVTAGSAKGYVYNAYLK